MLQIKREIEITVDPPDFIARLLGSGYFLFIQKNRDKLVFKRKAHYGSNGFEVIYKRLNPFNLLYVQVFPGKVTIVVYTGKILAFLLLFNLLFVFLLFMAGMPPKGFIFLPAVFLVMQILMVFFYGQLKITEIIEKIR